MKKLFGIYFIVIGMFNVLNSQIIDIPDQHFKDRLINHDPVIDINGDGEIQQTEAESFVWNIDVSGSISQPGEIQDIRGIEYFVNINSLNCEYNQISTLSLANNGSLQTLICNYNRITEINISNNTELRTLSASGNLFESINLNNNFNLEFLQSNFGQLNSLDISQNTLLQFLYVQGNSLIDLDLTNNPLLIGLIIDNNDIEDLNFAVNNTLNFVYCRNNKLSDLDISNNVGLITLDCKNNFQLEYIDIKNGTNENLIISGGPQSCNFENLPVLASVCLDDVCSDLTNFISAQVGHQVFFFNDCNLSNGDIKFPTITLFPNPTHQRLNVRSSSSIDQIEVYNLIGLRVLNKEITSTQIQLDVERLNRGMYIIKFFAEPNTYIIQRFIKF
jgi:hypothetical protein